MKTKAIGIIGASGKTVARVMKKLSEQGLSPRPLSRSSSIQFDWDDKSGWANALDGLDLLYVSYYPDLAVPKATSDISHLVELAKAQNIKKIVLLSGRGEDGAQRAEQILQNSNIEWNIIRASWFMQNFSESFMLEGIQAGELVLPTPKAKEPFIDVEDIADIAVEVLTREDLNNQLFEVTGPQLLSFRECIAAINDQVVEDREFNTVDLAGYLKQAASNGLEPDFAWLINELFSNVLDGRNAYTTDTVERILGRPARCFRDYLNVTVRSRVWGTPIQAENAK